MKNNFRTGPVPREPRNDGRMVIYYEDPSLERAVRAAVERGISHVQQEDERGTWHSIGYGVAGAWPKSALETARERDAQHGIAPPTPEIEPYQPPPPGEDPRVALVPAAGPSSPTEARMA